MFFSDANFTNSSSPALGLFGDVALKRASAWLLAVHTSCFILCWLPKERPFLESIHPLEEMLKYGNVLRCVAKSPATYVRSYATKSPFANRGPAPPQLDADEQKEFEKLQQAANTQIAIEQYNEDQGFKADDTPPKVVESDVGNFGKAMMTVPEFEGNVNPKTGEVNGPKQDPIRHGDWSFNGRVTDF